MTKIGKYRASFRKPKDPLATTLRESVAVAQQLKAEKAQREAEAKVRMDALRARNAKGAA